MADEERKITRYRVLYRRADGMLGEISTFDGPVAHAMTEAIGMLDGIEHESLVAVPTTNWTERRPNVKTITNVSFEELAETPAPASENPEMTGDGA